MLSSLTCSQKHSLWELFCKSLNRSNVTERPVYEYAYSSEPIHTVLRSSTRSVGYFYQDLSAVSLPLRFLHVALKFWSDAKQESELTQTTVVGSSRKGTTNDKL